MSALLLALGFAGVLVAYVAGLCVVMLPSIHRAATDSEDTP